MKRMILCLVLSLLLLLSCACATLAVVEPDASAPAKPSAPAPVAAAEAPAEPEPTQGLMPPYAASVTMQDIHEELKAEDGTVVLTFTGAFPLVEVDGNESATKAIYAYFQEKYEDYLKDDDEDGIVQRAKEDYDDLHEELPHIFPYEIQVNYSVMRADKTCLSFVMNEYSNTGGAHPNAACETVTFDTATGKKLEFADIVTDEKEARAFVEQSFLQYFEANEADLGLYEDYKEHVSEILDDDVWFFDEIGVTIIVNEYVVAPHAAGILNLTIPYAEFPQLKEAYSIAK